MHQSLLAHSEEGEREEDGRRTAALGPDRDAPLELLQEYSAPVLPCELGHELEVADDLRAEGSASRELVSARSSSSWAQDRRRRAQERGATHPEPFDELNLAVALCGSEEEAAAPSSALAVRDGSAGRASRRKVEQVDVRCVWLLENVSFLTIEWDNAAKGRTRWEEGGGEEDERTVDLRDDREVDVVQQVQGLCETSRRQLDRPRSTKKRERKGERKADARRGMSTRSEPSLCLPWNSHGCSLPSLSLVRSTTGLRMPGTAAEAMTARARSQRRDLRVGPRTRGRDCDRL